MNFIDEASKIFIEIDSLTDEALARYYKDLHTRYHNKDEALGRLLLFHSGNVIARRFMEQYI